MAVFGTCDKLVYITLFCAIFYFEWSVQNRIEAQVNNEIMFHIRRQAELCSKDTGVPAETAINNILGVIANDRAHKEFFYCVTHNTGYTDNDGHMDIDNVLNLNLVGGTKEDFANDMRECNKIIKEDSVENAYATTDCIKQKYYFTIPN